MQFRPFLTSRKPGELTGGKESRSRQCAEVYTEGGGEPELGIIQEQGQASVTSVGINRICLGYPSKHPTSSGPEMASDKCTAGLSIKHCQRKVIKVIDV